MSTASNPLPVLSVNEQMAETLRNKFILPFGEVMTILLADDPPETLDAVLFFGRARGDDGDELFHLAAKCIHGGAGYVIINGSDGERLGGAVKGESWAGQKSWTARLARANVPEQTILRSRPAFHTKDENDAFMDIVVERKWKRVGLLTQPHQSLRFMLGQLKSMRDRNYGINMYALHPKADWNKSVDGSQGLHELPRWVHSSLETIRLIPFWLKGDLSSPNELLRYFEEERDSI